jgi:hypothetical protein
MTDTMPKLTIHELSQTTKAANFVASWGSHGDLRNLSGETSEPASPLERSAMIAFEAITQRGEMGDPRGSRFHDDRNQMIDLMSNGMRLAVVEERQNFEPRSDIERARAILISTALVAEGRAAHDGSRDMPFDFTVLENVRKLSGMDRLEMNRPEAGALGVGMADLIDRADLKAAVAQTIAKGTQAFGDPELERAIIRSDVAVPLVRVRENGVPVSAAKGGVNAGPEMSELAKAMAGMDKQR